MQEPVFHSAVFSVLLFCVPGCCLSCFNNARTSLPFCCIICVRVLCSWLLLVLFHQCKNQSSILLYSLFCCFVYLAAACLVSTMQEPVFHSAVLPVLEFYVAGCCLSCFINARTSLPFCCILCFAVLCTWLLLVLFQQCKNQSSILLYYLC